MVKAPQQQDLEVKIEILTMGAGNAGHIDTFYQYIILALPLEF
jgi:hypothetical protein